MKETKFTRGPWFIKQSEEIRSPYSTNVSSTRITILDEPGGQYQSRHVIAQVAKGNGRGDANAALIAAAPEMYEALKKLKECLENFFGKTEKDFLNDCENGELFFSQQYIAVCKVLRKARGENE